MEIKSDQVTTCQFSSLIKIAEKIKFSALWVAMSVMLDITDVLTAFIFHIGCLLGQR